MSTPYESEIVTLTAVDENGIIAPVSYGVWRDVKPKPPIPPSYDASTAEAFKWGNATAGTGATIKYWFNTDYSWTDDQHDAFEAAMALWMAVADVDIVRVDDAAQASFKIQHVVTGKPGYWDNVDFVSPAVGSDRLGQLPQSTGNGIYIDPVYSPVTTDLAVGRGYGMQTLVHEFGHMLGLGHGGPYDNEVDAMVQQFGPYDTRLWTIMSYIDPDEAALYSNRYPVTGTTWNGYLPLTPMSLDILAIQRLYGVATDGPLTGGGHIFGFNSNIAGPIGLFFDFSRNKQPIVTLWENGHGNTLDLSGYSTDSVIDLRPGAFSSANGMKNNIAISFGTIIETGIGGSGDDTIYASDVGSFLFGNDGDDILWGGAANDVLSGGADPDTIDGGGGIDVLRDTLADMNGDTTFGFGLGTTIDIEDALIGRAHLSITANPDGSTTLGMGSTQMLLFGAVGGSGGDFMAVARGSGAQMHTDVSFESYLPQLFEGVAVAPDAVNGVANMPFLTGDGAVHFSVTLLQAVSTFANTLGYYTVASDGTIGDAGILFSDSHHHGQATVALATPDSGERIGFFLIQDGFSQFGNLSGNLSFMSDGGVANIGGGQPVFLQDGTLGRLDATIFHSFAALNPGGAEQVLSGVAPGGYDLRMGFEDLARAVGDNDFQDVVFNIHTDRDGVLVFG